jgi:hypothetical protein
VGDVSAQLADLREAPVLDLDEISRHMYSLADEHPDPIVVERI